MNHPEPETLAAYHAGELPEDEARSLQDHLLACRECAALLLDLDGLADPGFGAGSLAATDQEALWGRIQDGIQEDEAAAAPVLPPRRPARPSQATPQPRWLMALAASLLVATAKPPPPPCAAPRTPCGGVPNGPHPISGPASVSRETGASPFTQGGR